MKISIITAVYNNERHILDSIKSVIGQNYSNIEHIIIDGNSTDSTNDIIKKGTIDKTIYISEPDSGIYDAINKGLKIASGDYIGILHSDDVFHNKKVISEICDFIRDEGNPDIVYGDLIYVFQDNIDKILRLWKSGEFKTKKLKYGWMAPHPSIFIRRGLFEEEGLYDLRYMISADYDLILRFFSKESLKISYLNFITTRMRIGGVSNRNFQLVIKKMREDYKIIRRNRVGNILTLFLKNIRKLPQFIGRRKV